MTDTSSGLNSKINAVIECWIISYLPSILNIQMSIGKGGRADYFFDTPTTPAALDTCCPRPTTRALFKLCPANM